MTRETAVARVVTFPSPADYAGLTFEQRSRVVDRLDRLLRAYAETERDPDRRGRRHVNVKPRSSDE